MQFIKGTNELTSQLQLYNSDTAAIKWRPWAKTCE